ncbi:aspartyl/asparaginyl beta-hydroxylase domain-containing protein [Chitinophaga barathri]|uniref:Aspartyl/asparaginyl beta-hydroxylase domain-containing protein n=1 Tax=Chitinophaga barathri TaxID=1647451 RepID=A0A3N4MKN0_9BACT|nr:aspartyl/asparaginyl beta-hydroxylase domain-containing protein [Chitinophaga barathri]RPD42616.1 aspartyl/asparaginyl beta-hydroxylase domain-containing protein [Chitinophaga barathri]
MQTPYLRLPFLFNPALLEADLQRCLRGHWEQHFNAKDYDGSWQLIALRSMTGAEEDIRAHAGGQYLDTPLMEACPYFREITAQFECEKEAIRLLCLAPGSMVKEHRDQQTSYEDGHFRLHIPVITNPGVEFIVAGRQLPLVPGECWYANFDLPHSVANRGETDRVHLVLDLVRNEWIDRLFRDAGYIPPATGPDPETLQKIIAELRLQNTPAALALIAQLQQP